MATINEKMTGLANAIRSKAGVSGALSIDGMTAAVDGIVINPPSGEGADVSGVTATPADVLAGKAFVNSAGELVKGEIQTAKAPSTANNVVTIPAGYRSEEEKVTVGKAYEGDTTYTPGTADTILARGTYIKTMLRIKGDVSLTPDNIRHGVSIFDVVGTFTEDGDAEPEDIMDGKVAYVKGNPVYGTYKPQGSSSVDLSFITAEAGDIRSGKVGADAKGNPVHGTLVPDSGGGAGIQFYVCTGYDGVVEKIIITDGYKQSWEEEPKFSLKGEYIIVDPAAVGSNRKWYCAETTEYEDKQSYSWGVTIGCEDVEDGWDEETDGPAYIKRWYIYPGQTFSEYDWWFNAEESYGAESPFVVEYWEGNDHVEDTQPILTSEVVDVAPYGPNGWKGYRLAQDGVTGFWSRTNEYREGMTFSFFTPELGKVYSEDTSIACTALYSEADAHLVALYHFDETHEDAVGNTSAKLYGKSVEGGGKFAGCLYGDTYNATQNDSSYYMEISGLPEMDAFTIEWWQKDERDYGDGGAFMWQPEADGKARSTFLTVAIPKGDSRYIAGRWKHLAFVREAGSSTVTQYLNGKNVGTVEYADVLGGRVVNFIGLSPTTTQAKAVKIDELAIYAAAKYNDDFYPQDSPIIN